MIDTSHTPAQLAALEAPRPARLAPPERLPPPAPKEAALRAGPEHHRPGAHKAPHPEQTGSAPAPAPRPPLEPGMLLGPPPAFQASILDFENDLRAKLAQLAASRGREETRVILGGESLDGRAGTAASEGAGEAASRARRSGTPLTARDDAEADLRNDFNYDAQISEIEPNLSESRETPPGAAPPPGGSV
ncbi:hypothetical protein SAMN05216257_10731 [Meinhardsimonia xiamenensis]|jgi:hypothetical protein|uniref:Uncharacterized protein n=2 Tax=Meinhardsimonia xiamenensis TaxID=990712 RepID=A0A1G9GCZ6_9RHOB|nr:hypothetical protein [Meinhardsimonia xiamenensis]PRX31955.1 hypothetical protein LV81_02622 [Meinhardsimonia xiamenensis]SDK98549.1 hypothetical protein SAMN05216257_10731 [Meinhardsimonia xiamenensis]